MRLGAFHTLDLEGALWHPFGYNPHPKLSEATSRSHLRGTTYSRKADLFIVANREFRLTKVSGWDSVALERVTESVKEGRGAELGAIVCGEGASLVDLSGKPSCPSDVTASLKDSSELMTSRRNRCYLSTVRAYDRCPTEDRCLNTSQEKRWDVWP